MLSAFQDAACKYADREVGLLIPFMPFMIQFMSSWMEVFGGSSPGRPKPHNQEGLEVEDIDVLKLLFLIRYIGISRPILITLLL